MEALAIVGQWMQAERKKGVGQIAYTCRGFTRLVFDLHFSKQSGVTLPEMQANPQVPALLKIKWWYHAEEVAGHTRLKPGYAKGLKSLTRTCKQSRVKPY